MLWLGFLFWKEEYLRKKQKMKWEDIQKEVKIMEGERPKSDKPVRNAVTRVPLLEQQVLPRPSITIVVADMGKMVGST